MIPVYRSYIQRQIEESCLPYPLIDGLTEVIIVAETGEIDEETTKEVMEAIYRQRVANCIARRINLN